MNRNSIQYICIFREKGRGEEGVGNRELVCIREGAIERKSVNYVKDTGDS